MTIPLEPIKPKRISDQVFEQLRELIFRGELKPGGKVCRRLEISEQTYYRPPAPEAIMPLYFDPFWLSSSQENIAQILT